MVGSRGFWSRIPWAGLAVGGWVLWCLSQVGAHLVPWRKAITAWSRVSLADLWSAASLTAIPRHAALLGLAAVLACGLLNAGAVGQRLLPLPVARVWERRAIQLLLGFALLGAWYFGLALAGLFTAPVVLVSFVGVLVLRGPLTWWRELRSWRPAWPAAKAGWVWLGCTPVLLVLVLMLVPDTEVDVYAYHLAAPEKFLRLHKFSAEGISMLFHTSPMTAELVYALAVVLRLDALPHFIQALPFLAALALLVGWCARTGGHAAGWLTLVGVATFALVEMQLVIAKNDLAAAAYPLAGAVCLARGLFGGSGGWVLISAVLFGCGAAVKLNGFALLGLAFVGLVGGRVGRGHRGVRLPLVWLGLAVVPILPWLLKSWAMCGDPVWPFLSTSPPVPPV